MSLSHRIEVLGFDIDNLTQEEFLGKIAGAIKTRTPAQIVTANAAMLVEACSDAELAKILRGPDTLVTADGMSLVFASRYLGSGLKARVTGIDLIDGILASAEKNGWRVFFLGARQEVIREAVRVCQSRFPGLTVAGFQDGYFESAEAAAEAIRAANPDVLLVGMGFSMQEKWISRFQAAIGVPVAVGVGGSFDVIAGRLRRAPEWMQRAGLEWLYRLKQEKKRLWKRYLLSNSRFIWGVATTRRRAPFRIPDAMPHFYDSEDGLVYSSKNKIFRIKSLSQPKPECIAEIPWSGAEMISSIRFADRYLKNSILQVHKASRGIWLATTGHRWWRIENKKATEIRRFSDTRPMNRGICNSQSGWTFIAEYSQNPSRKAVSIFRTKDLLHFETAWTFPEKAVRHIHALIQDSVNPRRIWVLTGDLDPECGIYYTDDDFASLKSFLKSGQQSRATDLVRRGGELVWGMDSPDEPAFILRSAVDAVTPVKCTPVPGPIYYMASNESGALYAGTTVEKGLAVQDRKARIFGTSPEGDWQELVCLQKDWVPQHGIIYFPRGVMPENFLIYAQRALYPHEGCMTIVRDSRWKP